MREVLGDRLPQAGDRPAAGDGRPQALERVSVEGDVLRTVERVTEVSCGAEERAGLSRPRMAS